MKLKIKMRIFICAIMTGMCFLFSSLAIAGTNQNIVYQGRIVRPDGTTANSGTISFTLSVYSPAPKRCLLYSESQSVNMTGSQGMFSLKLGEGTRTAGVPTISTAFISGAALSGLTCGDGSTSYSPSANDDRDLVVSFNDNGTVVNLSAVNVQSVPYALQSNKIDGWGVNDIVKIHPTTGSPTTFTTAEMTVAKTITGLTCANNEIIKWNGTAWNCAPDATGSTPGDAGYGSANKGTVAFDTDAATSGITVASGVAKLSDVNSNVGSFGTAAKTVTVTVNAQGRITAASHQDIAIPASQITASGASNGEVLKWNGTAWAPAADATGTSPGDASYAAKGLVQGLTDEATSGLKIASGVISVNAGTGANQIVQLDASGKLPAVDGSALTNITATGYSGVLPVANGGTNSNTALNNNRLMVSSGGKIVEASAMTNGQIVVGSTGAAPAITTLGNSNGITITPGAGSLSIGTNATDANTASTIVSRDASGNFAAGAVTNTSNILKGSTSGQITMTVPGTVTPYTLTWPSGVGSAGSFLTTDASGNLSWGSPAAIADSSYATKGAVRFDTDAATSGVSVTSGVASVNAGTGANQIVKLNGSSQLPAVDGSLLTNLNAANIASGVLPIARGGTNNGSLAVTAGGILYMDGTRAQTTAAGTTGQALLSTGAGAPAFGNLNVPAGGTGATSFAANSLVMANGTGSALTGMTCSLGEILKWNGTAWSCSTGAGAVADAGYTSSNKGVVAFETDAATSGVSVTSGIAKVNTGTNANQIVKLDGSAKLPAVDGSALTNVTASSYSGVLPIANGGTNSSTTLNNNKVMVSSSGAIVEGNGFGSANTASTFVTRDASGNFAAGTITNSSNILKATSGSLTMTVPGTVTDYTLTWPAAVGSAGSFLTTDASGNLSWGSPAAIADASYSAKGAVQGLTDAATSGLNIASGVISVNSGTSANQIVKLDASAKLPAVDGSALTNISAGNLSGTVAVGNGGTGQSSYTAGDLLYASGATATSKLGIGASGTILTSSGSAPQWSTIGSLGFFVNGGNTFTGTAVLGSNSNHNLEIETNGTTRVVIENDGDVGVGATSPSEKFEVAGIAKVATLRVGSNVTEKSFQIDFPNGVANQKVDLSLGNAATTASFVVTVSSSYFGELAVGVLEKTFVLSASAGGTINHQEAYYSKAIGPVADRFAISDVTWDAVNSVYRVQIVHRTSVNNPIYVSLKALHSETNTVFKNASLGSIYTTDATVFAKPQMHFLGNLGFGVTDPSSAIDLNGSLTARGIAAPTNSPAGQGRIYFDSTANKFKVSQNGGAYVDLVPAGVSDASYASKGVVQGLTDAATSGLNINSGVISVNAGTSANQIVKLNGSAQLPAVDGSLLTNLSAANITAGTLPVGRGGTGATTFTSNGVLLGNGTSAVTATAAGAAYSVLRVPSGGGAPVFGSIDLSQSAAVTGTLGAANGGTGQASYTSGDMLYATGATAVSKLGIGASGTILTSTGSAPQWSAISSLGFFVDGGNTVTATAKLGTNSNHNLEIETNSTTKMTVEAGGDVGIGITNPAYRLDVNTSPTLVADNFYDVARFSESSTGHGVGIGYIANSAATGVQAGIVMTTGTGVNMAVGTANHGTAIVVKDSNGYVGIDVTDPQAPLHIHGKTIFDGGNPNKTGSLEVDQSSSTMTLTQANNGVTTSLVMVANDHAAFSFGGSEKFYVKNDGSVGINATVPSSILDVNGAITQRGMAAPTVSPAGQGRIYFDSTANKFKVSQDGAAYVDLVGGGSSGVTGVTAGTGLLVGTTAGGTISTTGTLNINTGTGANQIVQLDGSGKLPVLDGSALTNLSAASITAGTLPVGRGGTGLTAGTSGGIPYYSATNTMASSALLTQNGVVLGGGAGAAPTATAAGAAYSVLRVPSGGGAPVFGAIDLSQSAAVTGTLPIGNGGTGVTSFAVDRIVTTNGAGGLATLTCTQNQVISFNASGVYGCYNIGSIFSAFSDGGNTFTATATLGTNSNHNLEFETNSTTKLTILADGKVGVGTTAPSALFSVGADSQFRVDANGNINSMGGSLALASGSGGFASVSLIPSSSGIGALAFAQGDASALDTRIRRSGASAVTIDNNSTGAASLTVTGSTSLATVSGSVGVGTDSPQVKLEVVDGTLGIRSETQNPTMILWGQNGNTFPGSIEFAGSRSGGASDPNSLDTLGKILFRGGSASVASSAIYGVASENQAAGARGGFLAFHTTANTTTTSSERMRIEDGGNVGIGLTDPTEKLEVAGNVKISGALQNTAEKMQTSVTSGSSLTLASLANGSIYRVTLDNTATITLPSDPGITNGMAQVVVVITQDGSGSRGLTWAAPAGDNILWNQGTTPTVCGTASQKTIYQFVKINGDSTWYGSQVWKQCP